MKLPENRFKRAIAAGQQQIGLWNSITGTVTSELLATTGYDWLVIDTEHALTDVPDTLGMMQAMAPYPVSAVVRPAVNDIVLIKRLLDLGAQTLLIPYVQNAKEAQAAVTAMRYPPRGMRGVALITRGSRFGQVPDYATRADEELCLLVQVETVEALAEIEAIAAVDGVDGIFIGPSDLAASMGHPGNARHPEVVAAIKDAITRIKAAGKPAGILAVDPAFAHDCIAWGTTFTAVGVDVLLLLQAAKNMRAQFNTSP